MLSNKKAIIWLVDDNEFVINILEKGLLEAIQIIDIEKFTSFNSAITVLEENNINNMPQIILLDFDFGTEGTAKDFLKIIDSLQLEIKTKIFLYTNNQNESEVNNTLTHRLVYGLIHKTTPLNALVQILVTELDPDV